VIDDRVVLSERHHGTRGSNYCYIPVSGRLVHIGKLFKGKLLSGGRRRYYKYEIPLRSLAKKLEERVIIYDFSFSNQGYGPYCTRYFIDCSSGDVQVQYGIEEVGYGFELLGREVTWLELYNKYVPNLIRRVKDIQEKLDIELFFAEHSLRLEDIYNDPMDASVSALVLPSWQGRVKALKTYLRSVHELYVLMLVGEAIEGRTVYHAYSEKPSWWIASSSEYPTAVIETCDGRYTVWYQFSLKEWIEVVMRGLGRSMFGYEGVRKRQYVRPDIVIFKGDVRHRGDLERAESLLLIDAKIYLTQGDLEQLRAYAEGFKREYEKVHGIIACLEEAIYRTTLEKLGYTIIENVTPSHKGEAEFIEAVKETLSKL
jgi:hypothetical protein